MFTNTLFTQDNLFVLHGMNSASVDLIYLDPPFNSKRLYSAPVGSKAAGAAFKDMWTWEDVNNAYLEGMIEKYPSLAQFILATKDAHSKAMAAYLAYMAQRILEMHRVLANTGSFYLHCDPTASHYLKFLLDGIFGRTNFRNEIIWCYRGGGSSKSNFAKRHDVILRYSKTNDFVFNDEDIRIPYQAEGMGRKDDAMWGKHKGSDKVYKPNPLGKIPEDWWTINALNANDPERTGYPTQKPLALLHRIIKASSKAGDIVLDPFCGCVTTCVAAQQLGRRWIGIDIEKKSSAILIERLGNDAGIFSDFIHRSDIPKRTDIMTIAPDAGIKRRLYDQQHNCCNGCGSAFELRHFDIDHIIPKAKGGGDYYENFQLLCASCNRIKGDRPMEYLMTRLRTIEKAQAKISFGD
ncbi:MAG: DNA methyltransferase [Alphaproteobacteria bacterium]|nr:DNA methyltransferase [Alphaproteobacteria bacterium]